MRISPKTGNDMPVGDGISANCSMRSGAQMRSPPRPPPGENPRLSPFPARWTKPSTGRNGNAAGPAIGSTLSPAAIPTLTTKCAWQDKDRSMPGSSRCAWRMVRKVRGRDPAAAFSPDDWVAICGMIDESADRDILSQDRRFGTVPCGPRWQSRFIRSAGFLAVCRTACAGSRMEVRRRAGDTPGWRHASRVVRRISSSRSRTWCCRWTSPSNNLTHFLFGDVSESWQTPISRADLKRHHLAPFAWMCRIDAASAALSPTSISERCGPTALPSEPRVEAAPLPWFNTQNSACRTLCWRVAPGLRRGLMPRLKRCALL